MRDSNQGTSAVGTAKSPAPVIEGLLLPANRDS